MGALVAVRFLVSLDYLQSLWHLGNDLESPKSAIQIEQSELIRMFEGFRSLCTTLAVCMNLIPRKILYMILITYFSDS